MKNNGICVAVINHGCKLNQFEGQALEQKFREAGFGVTTFSKNMPPDITVINTCTVTGKSDRKSRNSIYRARDAKKPGGFVVVTGCYAQTNPGLLKKIEGVDLVVGNEHKPSLPEIVASLIKGQRYAVSKNSCFDFHDPEQPGHSRVYVKVQDGCSMRCSYCKVPSARGNSRSRHPDEICSYVKRIAEKGYNEVVLTGINLGSYNYHGKRLPGLISLLMEDEADCRIRLSSIEPVYFTEDLFHVLEHKRIAPHFHVPLQSGSERMLRLMKRPYSVTHYLDVVHTIKRTRPESHIAADVMVGFPTETEREFFHTLNTIRKAGFASVHVFRYSPRDGTSASRLPDSVPHQVKSRRCRTVQSLAHRLNYIYRRMFLGRVLEAVFEKHGEWWEGITENYIRVRVESSSHLNRKKLPVKITRVEDKKTCGKLL
ncbi:MAG: tRNA (N(6)-L-threonylcarbamoyladenosine(37)-C(2))-methylthiotransferase MtaB [Spirochaetota bacterium]